MMTDDKDDKELALVSALVKKQTNEDDKEDVWIRPNELSTFDSVGFGFFTTTVGAGAYNRGEKSTVPRQSITDRDALRGMGIRVPMGDRFRHASASLQRGCLHESNPADDIVLLSDRHPRSHELYDAFATTGKKA